MKIVARRTITFTTETELSYYPNMTPEQAVEYEKSLELGDVVDIMQFSGNVNHYVEVVTVD